MCVNDSSNYLGPDSSANVSRNDPGTDTKAHISFISPGTEKSVNVVDKRKKMKNIYKLLKYLSNFVYRDKHYSVMKCDDFQAANLEVYFSMFSRLGASMDWCVSSELQSVNSASPSATFRFHPHKSFLNHITSAVFTPRAVFLSGPAESETSLYFLIDSYQS